MWELLQRWLSARAPAERARRGFAEPDVWLHRILDDPGADALRQVWADWLIEREQPLGKVINAELRHGFTDAVWRGYAHHLGSVLGELVDVVVPSRFRLGLPVEAEVRGGRPDLLAHPLLDGLRRVDTRHPQVAGALAGRVEHLTVGSWGALEAALGHGGVLQIEDVDGGSCPPLRASRVILASPAPSRELVIAVLHSGIRELHLDGSFRVDPSLDRLLASHPTLEGMTWRGGSWGRAHPPLITRMRSIPRGFPESHVPIRLLGRGIDAPLWLAYDREAREACTVRLLGQAASRGARGPGVLGPRASFGYDPVVEIYPPVETAAVAPWPAGFEALLTRVEAAAGPLHPEADAQLVRREGELHLVAPAAGVPPGEGIRARFGSGSRLDWAATRSRGSGPLWNPTTWVVDGERFAVLEDHAATSAAHSGVYRAAEALLDGSLDSTHPTAAAVTGAFARIGETARLRWAGGVGIFCDGVLVNCPHWRVERDLPREVPVRTATRALADGAEESPLPDGTRRVALVTQGALEACDPRTLGALVAVGTPREAVGALRDWMARRGPVAPWSALVVDLSPTTG